MISEFKGEWRWLSNFAPATIFLDGVAYPSVEHAYVAAKTLDPQERARVLAAASAGEAKRLGRTFTLRGDWEEWKVLYMEEFLRQKYSQEPYASLLLSTGEQELQEGNTWGDRFWGVSPPRSGNGLNTLGSLTMSRREVLGSIPTEFRLIVAGGRDFSDAEMLHQQIMETQLLTPVGSRFTIVSGMARGADLLGHAWAKQQHVEVSEFPADWDTHGKAAGHIRNKQMADVAHGLLAFWDGESRGTKNMIETMQTMRKPVKIVRY